MINRKIITQILPSGTGRDIAISDIHGDLQSYESLLEKIKYKPFEDRLFLVGDMIEKGPHSLKLIRKIMEQKEEGEMIYPLMGNCDFIAKNFLYSYRLDFIRSVLLKRKHSIVYEMLEEIKKPAFDELTDMDQLAYILRMHFKKELSFLNELPHVIQTPQRTFVHASLQSEENPGEDFKEVLISSLFEEHSPSFKKPVIVGHMPVTEYNRRKADFSPRYHAAKNLYSIDGGNIVKCGGQLNALIFDGSTVYSECVDHLLTITAKTTTHPKNYAPLFITWNRGELQLIERGEKQSKVYSEHLKRRFWIDNEFLKNQKGSDFTTYEMPLIAGENLKLVCVYGNKAQVKKHGVLGWTHLSNLNLDPTLLPAFFYHSDDGAY